MPREALSRLLRREWEGAALIVQLVVEGTDPAVVAAERGVSHAVLVDLLRDAVALRGARYEAIAYAALGESAEEQARMALHTTTGRESPRRRCARGSGVMALGFH